MVLGEINAKKIWFFLDGIHGAPYIAAPRILHGIRYDKIHHVYRWYNQ
jgi:hypothetical protein